MGESLERDVVRIDYNRSDLTTSWKRDVEQAFEDLGWKCNVMDFNPAGDDQLYLRLPPVSDFDPTSAARILSDVGVVAAEFAVGAGRTTGALPIAFDAAWWGRCTDPRGLIGPLCPQGTPSRTSPPGLTDRQFWLCACAVARLAPRLWEGRAAPIFDRVERLAEGRAQGGEILEARKQQFGDLLPEPFGDLLWPPRSLRFWDPSDSFARAIVRIVYESLRRDSGLLAVTDEPTDPDLHRSIARRVTSPIRDVFDNPFRPTRLDAIWLRSAAADAPRRLANAIAEGGTFEDVRSLGPLLLDAKCPEPRAASHCTTGPHVKGCWLIDQLRLDAPS